MILRNSKVRSIFKGGSKQLDIFASNLHKLFGMQGKPNNDFIKKSDEIVITIYTRLIIMGMDDDRVRSGISAKLSELKFTVKNPIVLYNILILFKLHYSAPNFDSEKTNILELCKVKADTFVFDDILLENMGNRFEGKKAGFESIYEYLFYKKKKNNIDVDYIEGGISSFTKLSDALIDATIYDGAISILKKVFEYCPVYLYARCEIVNCLVNLRKFDLAKQLLFDMSDYLFDEKYISFFYRRLGFIFIEEKEIDTALACLQYSLSVNPESASAVKRELNFIRDHYKKEQLSSQDVKSCLTKKEIPILVPLTTQSFKAIGEELGYTVEFK